MIVIKYLMGIYQKLTVFASVSNRLNILRISIGIIYFCFGLLKFFDTLSPAEQLAKETLSVLCFGLIPEPVCLLLLASIETLIGLLLVFNMVLSRVIKVAVLHMLGTFAPLILEPEILFTTGSFEVSLIGQYIVKNIIIVSALWVIYPLGQTAIE